MKKKIERYYLEINSLKELKSSEIFSKEYSIKVVKPADFQLNKFFYKMVGKKHQWLDRLTWTDRQWVDYTSDKKIKTYILKKKNDLVGYFYLILHKNQI